MSQNPRIPSYGRPIPVDGPLTYGDPHPPRGASNRRPVYSEESFDGIDPDVPHATGKASTWRQVEQQVRHKVMAQVSVLEVPHGAPRYSIRIGTVRVTGRGEVLLSNHISIYDAEDAAILLEELGDKYIGLRNAQKRPRPEGSR